MRIPKHFKGFVLVLILIIILVVGVLWYCTPKTLFHEDSSVLSEIYIFDGNTGREMTISDPSAIHFIAEEFQDVRVKRVSPALGFGTSYHLKFVAVDGETITQFVLQTSNMVKQGNWFYTVMDDTKDFTALCVYLDNILDRPTGNRPAPPQLEDFQLPDWPMAEALEDLYPLSTDQIVFYWDMPEGGYSSGILLDQTILDQFFENVHYSSLCATSLAERYDCTPNFYLDFQNGTVLAYNGAFSYIWFGNALVIDQDGEGNILSCFITGDYIGPYSIKDESLSVYLLQFMTDCTEPSYQ